MENVDMNKLDQAIIYVERMADGMDPISGTPMAADNVLNNPDIIRSMFFVQEILKDVQHNGGVIGGKGPKQKRSEFPAGQAVEQFSFDTEQSIAYFVKQLNSYFDASQYMRLKCGDLGNALLVQGYLTEDYSLGKKHKVSTEKGKAIGIRTEKRTLRNGESYYVALYNQQAQEFIVRNLEKLLNGETDLS